MCPVRIQVLLNSLGLGVIDLCKKLNRNSRITVVEFDIALRTFLPSGEIKKHSTYGSEVPPTSAAGRFRQATTDKALKRITRSTACHNSHCEFALCDRLRSWPSVLVLAVGSAGRVTNCGQAYPLLVASPVECLLLHAQKNAREADEWRGFCAKNMSLPQSNNPVPRVVYGGNVLYFLSARYPTNRHRAAGAGLVPIDRTVCAPASKPTGHSASGTQKGPLRTRKPRNRGPASG